MKILKMLLAALLTLTPSVGVAQVGPFYTDRAVGTSQFNGFTGLVPLQYAQVRVCGLPLTVQSPCLPLAAITDVNGNALSVNGGNFGQVTTDIVGRFSFGGAASNYWIQVAATGSNTPQLSYPVSLGGTANGATIFNGVRFVFPGSTPLDVQVNALAAAGCGQISILAGTYSYSGTPITPRCVNVVGQGDQATRLTYTGTGAAWAIGNTEASAPTGFTTAEYVGLQDLTIVGPGSGTTSIGLHLGGDPAGTITPSNYFANGVDLVRVQLESFGTCIKWGNNAYLNQIFSSVIKGCSTGAYFPSTISNSGENINFIGSLIANNTSTTNGSALRLDAPNTDVHLIGSSIDYNASPAVKGTSPALESANSHWEHSAGEFIEASAGTFKLLGGEMIDTCTAACGADPQFIKLSGVGGTQLFVDGTTFASGHAITQAVNWTASGTYAQINMSHVPCYNGNGNIPLLTNSFAISRGVIIEDCEANGGAGKYTIGMPIVNSGGIQLQTSAGNPQFELFDTTGAAPTPHKYMRVTGGNLEFLNSAFSAVEGTMTDAGLWKLPTLQIGGGSTLSTSNQSGTGAICMATSCALVTPTIGAGSTLNLVVRATDTPGAITINAGTCTDRSVAVTGLTTTATISIGAAYAVEANIFTSAAQAVAGTAHYRICNPTAVNITLNAAASFNISTLQ